MKPPIFIDLESKYINDALAEHPEYGVFLDDIFQRQIAWFNRYGEPRIGSSAIEKVFDDIDVVSRVKKIELDLLKKIKSVCDTHGLKLYLVYGSLLGAVRDGGLIHGDDDIDVALMREDYDELMGLADEFEAPYFLQKPDNDNCFYGGYAKLKNTQSTSINPVNWWFDCCEGIGIDIFPLDTGCADNIRERFRLGRIKHLQRFLYAKAYGFYGRFMDMPLLVWKAYKYIGKLWTREQIVEKLDDVLRSGDKYVLGGPEVPFGVYTHYKNPRLMDRSAFDRTVTMDYEGIELEAPAEWDLVLSDMYGDNYLLPPSRDMFLERHGFYNPDVPYSNYKKRFNGLFKPMPEPGRKIVLIGDELMFYAYLKKYPQKDREPWKYISVPTVQDDSLSLAEAKYGHIEIESKEALQEAVDACSPEGIYSIICGYDIRSIESYVRECGIREYYFFCPTRVWIQYADYGLVKEELEKELGVNRNGHR